MSVSVVLKNVAKNLGEGPHWMASTGRLLFVDVEAGDIHNLMPAQDKHHVTHVGKWLAARRSVFSSPRQLFRWSWIPLEGIHAQFHPAIMPTAIV